MPKLHAIELLPDAAGEDAVRRDWAALRAAGLPSMADHTGESNTPHVTAIAVPAITGDDESRASETLGSLLSAPATLAGLAFFGGERVTLVRLVDVPDALVAAVLGLRGSTTGHQHPGWLPHCTLGRRIPRAELPRALEVVAASESDFSLVGLRRWDPDADRVRRL